jgi:hypothetical protein
VDSCTLDPFWQKAGSPADLDDDQIVDGLSTRLVTPDGACTVHLSPFQNLFGGSSGAPRVSLDGRHHTCARRRGECHAGVTTGG